MPSFLLDPQASIGRVSLRVRDLARSLDFYVRGLGFTVLGQTETTAVLGAVRGRVLIELHADPVATEKPRMTAGLYHFAILVPSRQDLANTLARLVTAGYGLTGASDHLVSEAIYLDDPDGLGIEIYRDRERSAWEHDGNHVVMDVLGLDLQKLIDEATYPVPPQIAPGTVIGHVHLHVGSLAKAKEFYVDGLGFADTASLPGALFVAAGGYHHHLGLNTWARSPESPNAAKLLEYEIVLPNPDAARSLADHLREVQISSEAAPDSLVLDDPFGNRIVVRTARSSA
jgi:catechol 2,3-dioxygenase